MDRSTALVVLGVFPPLCTKSCSRRMNDDARDGSGSFRHHAVQRDPVRAPLSPFHTHWVIIPDQPFQSPGLSPWLHVCLQRRPPPKKTAGCISSSLTSHGATLACLDLDLPPVVTILREGPKWTLTS